MIFVGIFFSERLFETSLYFTLFIGFILLCLASSFNYIINDMRDIEKDRNHPEKIKNKIIHPPNIINNSIAKEIEISPDARGFFLIFLIPNLGFAFMIILTIVTGQLYNHLFKNYAF
ncbi:unnamed protein product, partial [marine sediment metagenome]